MGNNKWNRDWIQSLVTSPQDFDPFPLQFANVDRIEANDAVFIFDEVGCGKTISAGLMALHYLWNHPEKKAAVVTHNSLVRPAAGKDYGQFLSDWLDRLPFEQINARLNEQRGEQLKLTDRICIKNNRFSNIAALGSGWFAGDGGILIIDEAHLFLTDEDPTKEEAERRKELCKLKAEKVVFLTATPIKRGKSDLDQYCDIAEEILQKKVDRERLKKELEHQTLGREHAICARFDVTSPVTRYFKDTVKALKDFAEGRTLQVRRQVPDIWEYGQEGPIAEIKKNILERWGKTPPEKPKDRFIVFVWFIEDEERIAEELKRDSDHFVEWRPNALHTGGKLSFCCVHGTSKYPISTFSHNGEGKLLPDILISTAQLAEAGVNLPGYNHVINYHIPAYPASLEQRFGRIDRMGQTKYTDIYMIYLLSSSGWGRNYINFHNAVWTYEKELLAILPSKNTVLAEKILTQYYDKNEKQREFIQTVKNLCKDLENVKAALNHLKKRKDTPPGAPLTEFCIARSFSYDDYADKSPEDFQKALQKEIEKLERQMPKQRDPDRVKALKSFLTAVGNQIFYYEKDSRDEINTGDTPQFLDAVKDCAEKINDCKAYRNYVKRFNEEVKLPKLQAKYAYKLKLQGKYGDKLEQYFEDQFLKTVPDQAAQYTGDFLNIFISPTPERYSAKMEQILKEQKMAPTDIECSFLIKNAQEIITELPFFRMCEEFRKNLLSYEGKGQHSTAVLKGSYEKLKDEGYVPDRIAGIDPEFTTYLKHIKNSDTFKVKLYCSNWLKLAIHCIEDSLYAGGLLKAQYKRWELLVATINCEPHWKAYKQKNSPPAASCDEKKLLHDFAETPEAQNLRKVIAEFCALAKDVQSSSKGRAFELFLTEREPCNGSDSGTWSTFLPVTGGYGRSQMLRPDLPDDQWSYCVFSALSEKDRFARDPLWWINFILCPNTRIWQNSGFKGEVLDRVKTELWNKLEK